MSSKPARIVRTGDLTGDRVQQNGVDAQRRLNASPFANGVIIDAEPGQPAGTGLSFSAGTARSIAHGLGRRATYVLELGLVGVPTPSVVGLRVTAIPSGLSSLTHVTVTPLFTGVCAMAVF